MVKRSPEQWQALFAAQQSSGLNQAQFCKREGLCPKHFSARRKQLLGANASATALGRFIKAQPPTSSSSGPISVHYQGVELRLQQTDTDFIVALVKQLV